MALVVIFIFGLVLGSFVNVCIYRLPRGLSVVRPGSRCPHCGHSISAWENIPVVSYVILRGRCHGCAQPISARYPLIELLVGAALALSYWRYAGSLEFLKFSSFLVSIILLVATDADVKQLPDEVTFSGIVVGVAFSLWLPMPGYSEASLWPALLGALVGGGSLWLVAEGYMRLRGREGMGLGDVKMMAMVGAFVGWKLAFLTIFFSAVAGSLAGIAAAAWILLKRALRWRRRGLPWSAARRRARASVHAFFSRHAIPFGVFLGTMSVVSWLWGLSIWSWYWERMTGGR